MSVKIKPSKGVIVLKRLPAEEKSKGGVILNNSEEPSSGTHKAIVVESGLSSSFTSGDKVIFHPNNSICETIDGNPFIFVTEGNILATFE